MKTIACWCFFFYTASAVLHAQNARPEPLLPPLPPGPLVQKRAPDFAQWIIRSELLKDGTAAKPAGSPPDRDKKPSWGSLVSMTKTGKIILRQRMDEKGQVWNTWCIGSNQTTIYPDGKHWIVQPPNRSRNAPTANYEDYSQSDFPGFEWVTLKDYKGLKEIQGKQCIIFQQTANAAPTGPEPATHSAIVDLETRYPVALSQGNETRTYEFKAPPQRMLTVPPLIEELQRDHERLLKTMTRRVPVQ